MIRFRPALLSALAAALCAAPASALVDPALAVSLVVQVGDSVGTENITEIDGVVVSDDGHVLVLVDVTGTFFLNDALLIDGTTVVLRAGDDAPGIATPEVLGSINGFARDDQGRLAFTAGLFEMPMSFTSAGQALFFDDTVLLRSGEFASWPGAAPGTEFLGFGRVRFAGDRLLLRVAIDDPTIPGIGQAALIFVDPATGAQEKVVAIGDPAPGVPTGTINSFADGKSAFDGNAAGQTIVSAQAFSTTLSSSVSLILKDGVPLAVEGSPSPVPGRLWDGFGSEVAVSIDDDGSVLFSGVLEGDAATSNVLIRDGEVLAQSGVTTQPDIAPQPYVNFDAPRELGENGDVLYYAGFWGGSVPSGQDQAIVLNGQFVVREGFTQVNGQTVTETYTGAFIERPFDMSPDGEVLAARVEVAGVESVIRVDRSTYDLVGEGLPAAGAPAPLLRGDGTLMGGDPYSATLSGAAPGAATFLVLGASNLSASFKGGVLVPFPDVIVDGLVTDAFGGWQLAGTWPAGLFSGLPFWMQVWIVDAGGPVGFTSTNGLTAVLP